MSSKRSSRKNKINDAENFKYSLTAIDHSTKGLSDPAHGEFVVHKAFQVTSPKEEQVYGYVIQLVQKVTDAYTIKKHNKIIKVEKIENISEFTSGYVNYMNDSYFELFFIINGQSKYGDNFQNGPILIYTPNPNNVTDIGPDDEIPTKGTINVTGTSWFIPGTKKDITKLCKEINSINSKMNINNKNSNTIEILGLNWSLNPNTPANGLPYIDTDKSKEVFKLGRASNVLEHTVNVKWDSTKSNGKTSISSKFKLYE